MPNLEVIACPLCHQTEATEWGVEKEYTAVKCQACGLVYVSPRPIPAELSEAVRLGAHATAAGVFDVRFHRSPIKAFLYRKILSDLFPFDRPISWLDVGAGYGEVLECVRTLAPVGSVIKGIEPMKYKAAHARRRGVDITSEELGSISEQFDVVSLVNVFSHIPDFSDFLAGIRRVLKPDGVLFIETGNAGDLTSRKEYPGALNLPDHLVFAGASHIDRFLANAGFQVTAIRARRTDTIFYFLIELAKVVLGRCARIMIPYTSKYRVLLICAKSVSGQAARSIVHMAPNAGGAGTGRSQ